MNFSVHPDYNNPKGWLNMENKKSFIKGALLGALIMLLISVIVSLGWRAVYGKRDTDGSASAVSFSEAESKLKVLSDIIDSDYLYQDDIDKEALLDGIYAGYVSGLGDPYTEYYNEEQTKELMESISGEFSGIGASLTQDLDTGIITISEMYEDSPAEKAGLKVGDILYQVDDREIGSEDLNEVVSWVKGEEGTEVTLHVYRGDEGEEVSCTAVRAEIEAQTVSYEMKEGQIGYIRVSEFETVTYEQFKTALDDLEANGMQGLVIDLRGNPGGDLDTVTDMLRLLLPKGVIVSTKDRDGNVEEEVNEEDHTFQKPLAVLINGSSASASEVFAGAIQDYGVGQLVGTTSYGKGVVQFLMDLEDGTSMKITSQEYFTPNGRNIHGTGITPDIEVEYEADPADETADNQLEKALEAVRG